MRAKTVKRLAILIAVFGLIGGAGFQGWKYQIDTMGKSKLEKAKHAEEAGDFTEAEQIYRQYLGVVPDDVEVKIKYADLLLKGPKSSKRLSDAYQLYYGILKKSQTWRADVQRKSMQWKIDQKLFTSKQEIGKNIEGADLDLDVLLKRSPDDGELLFLRGRCYEEGGDWGEAAIKYARAIEQNAPQWIEAYQRRAALLRDHLREPAEADQAIETMVKSAPENYKVYMARGQYCLSDQDQSKRTSLRQTARHNFQEALKRAPAEPEIYHALAMISWEEGNSGRDEARQLLESGLKKAPKSMALYWWLAEIERRNGLVNEAIKTLQNGVKEVDRPADLHFMLAELLAGQQDSSKLESEIAELRKLDVSKGCVDYLTALGLLNVNEFAKARQYLLPLQGGNGLPAGYKVRVNLLLAQCCERLGEPERAQEYYRQVLIDDPQNVKAKLARSQNLVNQGEIEEAITQYRALVQQNPGLRLPLANLLITRNRRRPESQRDWIEPERLIKEVAKDAPKSVDPVIAGAELLLAQDKVDEALNVLTKARVRFPERVEPWTVPATVMGQQGRIDEALSLLDQAQRQLGDQVGLRLERALLWSNKKSGPRVLEVWNKLSQNTESFSKEDRRRLLSGLAAISRQQDPALAARLWSQLAEEHPDDINIRLELFELALETDSKDDIKKNIEQIKRIEGNDGLLGRYCEALRLIKQAGKERDKKKQSELRASARVLLNELVSRRKEWSRLPLALAALEEQELAQGGLTENEQQAKEGNIVNYYLRAINLGQRPPGAVRRALKLLFKRGDDTIAVELLKSLPAELRAAVDLGRVAEEFAIEKKWQLANQVAQTAVAENPGDFQEQSRLVQILLAGGNRDEAEAELRKAVDLSKSDPNRWITLVKFMVLTKQLVKAERAIRDAEANLPQPQAPLALAQCCDLVGQAYYEQENTGDAAKKWYAEVKKWYEKALAAQPDDLSVRYLLTEFFRKTRQVSEAKSQLDAILKQGPGAKRTDIVAWANRTRALMAASDTDAREVRNALSYFEPPGHPAPNGQEGKTLKDPEDLRALARVLKAQRTPEQRARAIEILESLTTKNPTNSEDQFLLAQLYELSNDWPKARATYEELSLQLKNARDLETLSRRPFYLGAFAEGLLKHHRPGEKQELTKAQALIDEIKQLQPDAPATLFLEVELDLASNRLESAASQIEAYAARPQPSPQLLGTLASLAEGKLGRFDLAEQLYRQRAALPGALQGKIELARFLGRCDRPKEALNVLEPLLAGAGEIEKVLAVCIDVLLGGNRTPDSVEFNRACGWFDRALKEKPGSIMLLVGLATLREKQGRYDEAEASYRSAIKLGEGKETAPATKLIADVYNNLAWLVAHKKDGKAEAALDYINHAVKLNGTPPEYLDTRGVIYLMCGDSKHAIDDLEKAVNLAPSSHTYFHLAQAYLAAGNKEKARQSLKAAKITGWEQSGLDPREKGAYQKLQTELGTP
jgi:tetratricopeptide (TPR) repeat protein